MGYNYTTQSKDSQTIFNNVLKDSLLTNFGNDTLCSPILKKMLCSEFAPPCFPEDATEIVIRTVCKSDCEELATQCPDLYETHFEALSYCEQMATEKSTDLRGFCQLTKWPTADRWSQQLTVKGIVYTCFLGANTPRIFVICELKVNIFFIQRQSNNQRSFLYLYFHRVIWGGAS